MHLPLYLQSIPLHLFYFHDVYPFNLLSPWSSNSSSSSLLLRLRRRELRKPRKVLLSFLFPAVEGSLGPADGDLVLACEEAFHCLRR